MKRLIIIAAAASLAAIGAAHAFSPLLSSNSFIYFGWVFGQSAFGTGHF